MSGLPELPGVPDGTPVRALTITYRGGFFPTSTVAREVASLLAGLEPGLTVLVLNRQPYSVTVDREQARGDLGGLVKDTYTGTITISKGTGQDTKYLASQHISPYGGKYGNPYAYGYAVDQVADTVARDLSRAYDRGEVTLT